MLSWDYEAGISKANVCSLAGLVVERAEAHPGKICVEGLRREEAERGVFGGGIVVPPVCPNVTLNLTGRILPSKDACEEDQGVYKSLHICSSPWRPRRHREIAIFDPVLTILSFSSTPGARPSPPAAPSRARRPPRAESCCGEAGREVRLGGECRRLLAAARGGREGLRELIVFFFSFFFFLLTLLEFGFVL